MKTETSARVIQGFRGVINDTYTYYREVYYVALKVMKYYQSRFYISNAKPLTVAVIMGLERAYELTGTIDSALALELLTWHVINPEAPRTWVDEEKEKQYMKHFARVRRELLPYIESTQNETTETEIETILSISSITALIRFGIKSADNMTAQSIVMDLSKHLSTYSEKTLNIMSYQIREELCREQANKSANVLKMWTSFRADITCRQHNLMEGVL